MRWLSEENKPIYTSIQMTSLEWARPRTLSFLLSLVVIGLHLLDIAHELVIAILDSSSLSSRQWLANWFSLCWCVWMGGNAAHLSTSWDDIRWRSIDKNEQHMIKVRRCFEGREWYRISTFDDDWRWKVNVERWTCSSFDLTIEKKEELLQHLTIWHKFPRQRACSTTKRKCHVESMRFESKMCTWHWTDENYCASNRLLWLLGCGKDTNKPIWSDLRFVRKHNWTDMGNLTPRCWFR